MSEFISRPWSSVLVAALALSTVHALPIQDSEAHGIEARSPRIIPDTTNYVHNVLENLGLGGLSPTATKTVTATAAAAATPSATQQVEQSRLDDDSTEKNRSAQPSPGTIYSQSSYSEDRGPTPTTHITYQSSTSYTPTHGSNGAGYTQTVKHHESHSPVNIQLMHGWSKDRKLTAEDLPVVFDAVYRELKHQVADINSSDELGLDGFMSDLENF
ncbi:hypothetical protein LTR66_014797 [Elasticomyces elasticus]|nr:hypothetical protein LTR66_014797 [Elasticomyces elasticus]